MSVPITKFGKDHWSTLAYLECRVVDHRGQLDERHLRCSVKTLSERALPGEWRDEYSTRLRDGTQESGHDDWDCISDLMKEGLVDVSIVEKKSIFRLTADGWALAGKLRRWKAQGGTFATFDPERQP